MAAAAAVVEMDHKLHAQNDLCQKILIRQKKEEKSTNRTMRYDAANGHGGGSGIGNGSPSE